MRPRKPEIGYCRECIMQENHLVAAPLEPLLPGPGMPAVCVTRVVSKPHSAPRFVVQLCQSAQPIDPDDVPQLALFDLYHLYCDNKSRREETRHSLRLGYFKEPGTAKAIAGYLALYFHSPLVIQIDAAEIVSSLREKFLPRKDIGAAGQHTAVVLAAPPPLPVKTHAAATTQRPNRRVAARSLWSLLLEPLRRLHAATQEN
jgi:hypothetical protein